MIDQVIAVILLLSATSMAYDDTYRVQQISSKPGLQFEKMGNLQFYYSEWTVITFVSLDGLEKEFQVINEGLEKLKTLCKNPGFSYNNYFFNFTICTNDLHMLEINFQHVTKSRSVIQSLVGHRAKRGLLNVVGNVQKYLFGTLSAGDGEYYDAQLQTITNNLGDSLTLIKDQSQVVGDCIKKFNETINNAEYNEGLLRQKTEELTNAVNVARQKLSTVQTEQLVEECSSRLMFLINKYRTDVESLINSILFAKMGLLHPSIITPDVLVDTLKEADHVLPDESRFPVPLDHEQGHNLLRMMRITAYYTNGKLIILLHLPLVRTANYDYYHVTPLPFHIENSTYGYIKPEEPYFLVDSPRAEFSIMSEFDLSKCYTFDNGFDVVCKGAHPLLSISSSTLCTASLFYLPNKLPLSCETRVLNIKSALWEPLITSNSWIYCLHEPVKITVQCPKRMQVQITLRNLGIIEIYPPCVGYAPNYILAPKQTTGVPTTTTLIPDFNITIDWNNLEHLRSVNFSDWSPSIPINLKTLKIENLQLASMRLNEISHKAEEIQFRNRIEQHTSSYRYAVIAIGIIVALLVAWKLKLLCRKNRNSKNNGPIINFNSKTETVTLPDTSMRYDHDPLPPKPNARTASVSHVRDNQEEEEQRRNLIFPV